VDLGVKGAKFIPKQCLPRGRFSKDIRKIAQHFNLAHWFGGKYLGVFIYK
jgi:hypothetical protein